MRKAWDMEAIIASYQDTGIDNYILNLSDEVVSIAQVNLNLLQYLVNQAREGMNVLISISRHAVAIGVSAAGV
jgi:hypothetical protein